MAVTETGLITAVRRDMRVDPNGRIWNDDDVLRAIGDAILKLQDDGNYNWQFNKGDVTILSVAAQAEYSLLTNFPLFQSATVVEFEDRTLRSTQKEFTVVEFQTIPTGTPIEYYIYDGVLGLSPTPTTVGKDIRMLYQLRLVLDPDTGADNSALLTLLDELFTEDTRFRRAIILYSGYILFSETSDAKSAQRASIKLQRYRDARNGLRLSFFKQDNEQVNYKTAYVSRHTLRRRRRATNIIVIN